MRPIREKSNHSHDAAGDELRRHRLRVHAEGMQEPALAMLCVCLMQANAPIRASDLRGALRSLEVGLYKFLFTAMAAQTALIVALIELLK